MQSIIRNQVNLRTSWKNRLNSEAYNSFLQADTKQLGPSPNVIEVTGDLFETESNIPLAHCVSADLKMDKGIALEFRRKFGKLAELQKQKSSVT